LSERRKKMKMLENQMRGRIHTILNLAAQNIFGAISEVQNATEKLKVASEDEHSFQASTGVDIFPDSEAYSVVEALDDVRRTLEAQLAEMSTLIQRTKGEGHGES
jgi:hypothetical protein